MGQDVVQFSYFFGWVGGKGWLEKSDIKLISTQVVVKIEVGVELGNTVCLLKVRQHLKISQIMYVEIYPNIQLPCSQLLFKLGQF